MLNADNFSLYAVAMAVGIADRPQTPVAVSPQSDSGFHVQLYLESFLHQLIYWNITTFGVIGGMAMLVAILLILVYGAVWTLLFIAIWAALRLR
jgi:hypothetical protein